MSEDSGAAPDKHKKMAIAEVENIDNWKLSSLNISHYVWEKDSPYKGKITFTNKSEESLSFNIPQDKMAALLSLIADSVIDSANRLGHRVAASVAKTVNQQELPPSDSDIPTL